MDWTEILLLCGVSSVTAAAGWLAARLAHPDNSQANLGVQSHSETADDQQSTALKSSLIEALEEAIASDQVELHYQPKLDVRNSCFPAVEALFRWNGSKAQHLSISDLICEAEEAGLIGELTLWSLRRAVHDQLELIDRGFDIVTHVNLSGLLVSDSEFTIQAIDILKHAPGKIGLEITETAIIEQSDVALKNLEMYASAGATIAIDDYGTGVSSLRYLKRIPASELKIDREFIKDLTHSHRDPMIVRSTIDLAHALEMKVTAEGVDDSTKLALLKVMGCDLLQGFHIAKPLPIEALFEFLNDLEHRENLANPELSLLPVGKGTTGT